MKYYLIAGEASGDLHGSNLLKEIRHNDPQADFRCWGGEQMAAAGATVVKHYRDLAFMGFVEVIKNLPTILGNLSFCKTDIEAFSPDVLILIDYPGFNLRIAEWAKQKGFKVVYYISPQVWAWKENRVKKIRRVVDKMLVILPFEQAFFEDKWQYKVDFVGHPLVQVVADFKASGVKPLHMGQPIIALLPGSRKQEIKTKLPLMLAASRNFPQYQFVVAKATALDDAFYQPFLAAYPKVASVRGETYRLLISARAALVTSGTATLETALFGVPQVVCYKGSPISYAIAKRIITIRYISLVNLIMNKAVVTELIQHDLTTVRIERELNDLLHNPARQEQIAADYRHLQQMLQQYGNASHRAAALIAEFMATKKAG